VEQWHQAEPESWQLVVVIVSIRQA